MKIKQKERSRRVELKKKLIGETSCFGYEKLSKCGNQMLGGFGRFHEKLNVASLGYGVLLRKGCRFSSRW